MNREIKKIKQLFAALDDSAVRYCHWKSNQHLEEALAGKTDLDILVDDAQAELCRQILQENGCKQVASQPRSQYPGIEDWLAFDEETGRLAHIHLHFRLITGSHPKNYHLPVESWLLSDRRSLYDLKIVAHEKELIVLLVRIALKTRYLELLRALLVPGYEFLPRTIRAELDWLLARVQLDTITGHLTASGLPVSVARLIDCINRYTSGRLTPAYFLGFRVSLARSLKKCMIRSFASMQIRRAKFFITSLFPRAQIRKSLCGRGIFFALVGADGSGKTRLVKDLRLWLGWKLEADVFYFGIPKSNRTYRFLIKAMDVIGRLGKKACSLKCNPFGKLPDAVIGSINSLVWVYIAYGRFALGRQAQAVRGKGFVAIGERFPLSHFMSMTEPMDGPRLQKPPNIGMLSGLERFFYKKIALPDRLFVLKAGVEVLHARKNITPMTTLCEKAESVNRIKIDAKTTVVDAEASYESVLCMIKRDVWNML